MFARFLICFTVLILIASPLIAFPMVHHWSDGFGDSSGRYVNSVVDHEGNLIIAGPFLSTVDFGGGPLVSAGGNDIYIAKFDANGNHLWSYRYGGASSDFVAGLAVDESGDIYITGHFYASLDLGGGTLTSAGSSDIFMAKYDPSGAYVWSYRYGGTSGDSATEIAVDPTGAVFISGSFDVPLNLGGDTLVPVGDLAFFVAKFDASGVHIWSKSHGSTYDSYFVTGSTVDASGNAYIAGWWEEQVNSPLGVAGTTAFYAGGKFLYKYDPSGTLLWSEGFRQSQSDVDVAVDTSGDVWLAGGIWGTADFGGGELTSAGEQDVFIARFDSDGNHIWSDHYGDANYDQARGICIDDAGNVMVAGYFENSIDFGGGVLTSAGDMDVFVARFDPTVTHEWSQRFGGGQAQIALHVDADHSGNAYIAGYFEGAIDFGDGLLTSVSDNDVFVAKLLQHRPTSSRVEDIGNDQGGRVRINFARSSLDAAGSSTPILQYEVYRRIDTLPGTQISPGTNTVQLSVASDQSSTSQNWEFVGAVPAHGETEYNMIVPTLADPSIANGMHWSVFFIRAATANPLVYYDSEPDSGYSLDNLAPSAPQGLSMSPEQVLSWEPCPETDVDRYTIYGRLSPTAGGTGERELIGNTTDTQYDLTQSSFYSTYCVTAIDKAGNEGEAAEYDRSPTGVGQRPAAPRITIRAYPNPFNPRTSITYSVPSTAHVRISIYNVQGQLIKVLVDKIVAEGTHQASWSGLDSGDREVTSGVYFVRMESGDVVQTQKLMLLK
jgi:hypothetical protein